jgi:hypothetical protein
LVSHTQTALSQFFPNLRVMGFMHGATKLHSALMIATKILPVLSKTVRKGSTCVHIYTHTYIHTYIHSTSSLQMPILAS